MTRTFANRLGAVVVASTALALAGCATLEPEPCTPAWVDWKKDRILTDFTRAHRSEINTIKVLRAELEAPDAWTVVKIAAATDGLREMVETFNTRTVPDVRAAISQCGGGLKAIELFSDMLEREGVDPEAVSWIVSLGAAFPVETR